MSGYSKLDCGIVDSSLWEMPHEYLRVWIAMLSKTDATGYVRVSPPAMARLCHLNREEFDTIIEAYCAPDPESRTEDHEGRRLAKVEGGWQILNYVNYREGLKQPDSSAGRMRKLREKKKCDGFAVTVTVGDAYAEAEAEAEAEAKSKYKENTPPTPQGGSRVVIDPDSPAGELLASIGKKRQSPKDTPPKLPDTTPEEPSQGDRFMPNGDMVTADGTVIPRQVAWDNAFSGFWERYPKQRRKGRGAAEKSWHKLCGDKELYDSIVWALECQCDQPSWTKDNGQYVPLPATWLNQKRWEDEVEDIQPEDFTSIGGSRECTYEEADRILRECGLRK